VQLVTTSNRGSIPVASIPEYNLWQQQSSIFQQVAAYDWGGTGMNLTAETILSSCSGSVSPADTSHCSGFLMTPDCRMGTKREKRSPGAWWT
jgi:hypothetical protein